MITAPCPHCGAFAKRCEADVNTKGRDGHDNPLLPADRRICSITNIVIERYDEAVRS